MARRLGVAWLVVGLMGLWGLAGAVYTNDTCTIAYGFRIAFEAPVEITSHAPAFSLQVPEGEASEFTFSSGTVLPGGSFWLSWRPGSVKVMSTEWLASLPVSYGGTELLPTGTVCGIHLGGRWGTTPSAIQYLPGSYFQFLCRINANWFGISISLTIKDSMDAVVKTCGSDDDLQTFSDVELRNLIRKLRSYGFHVYLTLAFESMGDGPPGRRVERWQLGDPYIYKYAKNIAKKYWPWDPAHPEHESYVQTFFETYTRQAVHFAQIAEEEGVELFSLGTETDRLFRTRAFGARWPTEFSSELKAMVKAVRSVYSGLLTYDMLYSSFQPDNRLLSNSMELWGDLSLDVIGVSAYFQLLDQPVNGVPSVEMLKAAWRRIFNTSLIPVRHRYPDKPIVFLECGYTNAPGSAAAPAISEYEPKQLIDRNENYLDDGEEEQANIFEALFEVMQEFPGVLSGLFVWGCMLASNAQWKDSFGSARQFCPRGFLAETVISKWYAELGGSTVCQEGMVPHVERLPIPGQLSPDMFVGLPEILSLQEERVHYGVLDLSTSKYTETAESDERFGDRGWKIVRISGGVTSRGLLIVLEFALGDVPSEDPRIEHVLVFGDNEFRVHIRPGAQTIGLYDVSSEREVEWQSTLANLMKRDNLVYVFIPLGKLSELTDLFSRATPINVSYHVAYRGDSTHAFAFWDANGELEWLGKSH